MLNKTLAPFRKLFASPVPSWLRVYSLPRFQRIKFISCFIIGSSSFDLVEIQPYLTIFFTLWMKTWYKNKKNFQSIFFQNCSTAYVSAYCSGSYYCTLNIASSAFSERIAYCISSWNHNFPVDLNANVTVGSIFALPPSLGKPPKHTKLLFF